MILMIIESHCTTDKQTKPLLESVVVDYDYLSIYYINSKIKRRNRGTLNKENKLVFGKRCYKYTAIDIFNNLPLKLRSLSFGSYCIKNKFKGWIKQNIDSKIEI